MLPGRSIHFTRGWTTPEHRVDGWIIMQAAQQIDTKRKTLTRARRRALTHTQRPASSTQQKALSCAIQEKNACTLRLV